MTKVDEDDKNIQVLEKVMEKIEAWYFEEGEEGGEALSRKFALKYEGKFDKDCDAEQQEQTLEMTAIHNEFCDLYEKNIERLIEEVGSTPEEFFDVIKNALSGDHEEAPFYLELILACTDYTEFIRMMQDHKQRMAEEEEND